MNIMSNAYIVSNLPGGRAVRGHVSSTCSAQKFSLHCAQIPAPGPAIGLAIPGIPEYMAIINSMGVGRARKSMGNVTYRTVRGRTIGSQKVTPGAVTRVPSAGQSKRQNVFGLINRFMALHGESIDESFNRTTYGSQRNYFMKVNYNALAAALAEVPDDASDDDIEEAIATYAGTNQTAIYRVKKSGYPVVYLTGAWDDSQNPMSGVVKLDGTTLRASDYAKALTTGQALRIEGDNLNGEVTLVTTASIGGSTTSQSQATALTGVSLSPQLITGSIAAALNGKYLVAVKVGNTTIVQLKNQEDQLG